MSISHRIAAVLALVAVSAGSALAQAWPQRPVRVIVPFAAGGNTDQQARITAETSSVECGNTTASGETAVKCDSSRPCCSSTLAPVEQRSPSCDLSSASRAEGSGILAMGGAG